MFCTSTSRGNQAEEIDTDPGIRSTSSVGETEEVQKIIMAPTPPSKKDDDIHDQKRRIQSLANSGGATTEEAKEEQGARTGDDDDIHDQKRRVRALVEDGNGNAGDEAAKSKTDEMSKQTVSSSTSESILDQKRRIQGSGRKGHNGLGDPATSSTSSARTPSSSMPGAHAIYPDGEDGGGRVGNAHVGDSPPQSPGQRPPDMADDAAATALDAHLVIDADAADDENNGVAAQYNDEDFEARIQQRIKERTISAAGVEIVQEVAPSPGTSGATGWQRQSIRNSQAETTSSKVHESYETSNKKNLLMCIFVFGLICVIGVILGVMVYDGDDVDETFDDLDGDDQALGEDDGSSSMVAQANFKDYMIELLTTTSITLPNTGNEGDINANPIYVISNVSELLSSDEDNNHRYRALEWLVNEDSYYFGNYHNDDETNETMAESSGLFATKLIERFVVVLFYYASGGEDSWVGGQATELLQFLNTSKSVCEWNSIPQGVQCNDQGHVNYLNFSKSL